MRVAGIVATYNQASFVQEAIEGLIDQVDELVVVDDHSSDASAEVLAQYSGAAHVTVIVNERRLGPSLSYQRAVDVATSDILVIQGGDDRSLPGRAAASARALEDPSVMLAYSLPTVIDASGAVLPDWLGEEFRAGENVEDPLSFLFFEANYVCAPASAVRRPDYVRLGGFRAGIDLLQDYDLWLALAAEGRFALLDDPVVEYRKHGSNLSRERGSIDSPRQRRFSLEQEMIRNTFLDNATPKTLGRLAASRNIDMTMFSGLDRGEMATVVRLAHRDRTVLRRGVSEVFAIAASRDGEKRLARLGLSLDDLTRLAVMADVESRGDVAHALATRHLLNES